MNTKLSRILSSLVAATLLLVSATALAGAAQDYLQAKQRELTSLIAKPKSPANDASLKRTFDALLDYDALAKNSLGKHWDGRSDAEKKEFRDLLVTLVQSAYTKNIRSTLDYNITFAGSQKAQDGELIQTVAKHKTDARKEVIHIDYLVHQVGGNWRVYDIITERSSLVKNYNSQFRRIIEKGGFPDLIERMKKKAAEETK